MYYLRTKYRLWSAQSEATGTLVLAPLPLKSIYTVGTDACDKPVGFVLLQKQTEGTNRLLRYWSRSINDAKGVYDTTNSEGRRLLWAVLLLQFYLEGSWFTDCTDHSALKWILNTTN